MKRSVVLLLVVLLLLSACSPQNSEAEAGDAVDADDVAYVAEGSEIPHIYESEEAFINAVSLAKTEAMASEAQSDKTEVRDFERERRAKHKLAERTEYFSLSEIPKGYELGYISVKDNYIHVIYLLADIERDMYSFYDDIILYYYPYASSYGPALIDGFIRAYAEYEHYSLNVDGAAYTFQLLGQSKVVWFDVDGTTLELACPVGWTDEEAIALTKLVERVSVE